MMTDFKALEACGSTNSRLREVFTAIPFPNEEEKAKASPEEVKKRDRDVKTRKYWEDRIGAHLDEHVSFSLKNSPIYGAVDAAWDQVLNPEQMHLLSLAHGLIDSRTCISALTTLGCIDEYAKKDDKGTVVGVAIPEFVQANINLVRSVITRRLDAQTARYNALYPAYKYESRSTSQVGKLLADVVSQRADIMCDDFNYRQHEEQVYRDTMLYSHSVDFVRAAWERDVGWEAKELPDVIRGTDAKPEMKEVVKREGVVTVNPRPERVFYDLAFPLSSLQSDSGCTYLGYWDIVPYRAIRNNPSYYNKEEVSYNAGFIGILNAYTPYFTNHYTRIKVPSCDRSTFDIENDRSKNIGRYSSDDQDAATLVSYYFAKITPSEWGIGTYEYPVWVRFITSGNTTVNYAEFLPSYPALYCGLHEDDKRRVNVSMAMELLPFQDAMNNLVSQLLVAIRNEQIKIFMMNKDVLDEADQKKLDKLITQKEWFVDPIFVRYSADKADRLGLDVDKVLKLVQPQSNPQSITFIFQAITNLIALVERLMSMSPNESGQPIVRGNGGVSATEASILEGTTNAIYSAISDAFDRYRAQKKQLILESWLQMGEEEINVPIINRYTLNTIQKAGLTPYSEDTNTAEGAAVMNRIYIRGPKRNIRHNFIFTTRDGAERENNVQTATTLVQMLPLITSNEQILKKVGPNRLYELFNEIFRKSGAGVDLNIEPDPTDEGFSTTVEQQVEQLVQQIQTFEKGISDLIGVVQKSAEDIQKVNQTLEELDADHKMTQKNLMDAIGVLQSTDRSFAGEITSINKAIEKLRQKPTKQT